MLSDLTRARCTVSVANVRKVLRYREMYFCPQNADGRSLQEVKSIKGCSYGTVEFKTNVVFSCEHHLALTTAPIYRFFEQDSFIIQCVNNLHWKLRFNTVKSGECSPGGYLENFKFHRVILQKKLQVCGAFL